MKSFHISFKIIYTQLMFHCIWLEGFYIGMAAFSCKVNYTNNLMKSTSKTGLIAEIAQVIKHEVIENEIVDLKCFISQFKQCILQSLVTNVS